MQLIVSADRTQKVLRYASTFSSLGLQSKKPRAG